jgi:hypothetical protein
MKSLELSIEELFSLSISYISFLPKHMLKLLEQLELGCQVMFSENGYVEYDSIKKLLKKKLILEINDTKIGLKVEDLLKQKITLNTAKYRWV